MLAHFHCLSSWCLWSLLCITLLERQHQSPAVVACLNQDCCLTSFARMKTLLLQACCCPALGIFEHQESLHAGFRGPRKACQLQWRNPCLKIKTFHSQGDRSQIFTCATLGSAGHLGGMRAKLCPLHRSPGDSGEGCCHRCRPGRPCWPG